MAPDNPSPWTLTARWVFPVAGRPLERGTVTVSGESIAAVEPAGRRAADVDLGETAALPGLVNAHTHLDLTGLRSLAPPSPDFTGWLRRVIAHRRGRTAGQVQADIRAGLAESLRCGTTLLGDISGDGGSWDALAHAPLRAVVFREILGLPEERASRSWADTQDWMIGRSAAATATCRPGISPHAPYSVRGWVFAAAAAAAVPVAVHLAESAAELELLSNHRGPFVPFLRDLGVWDPAGLVERPEDILEIFECSLNARPLFVHANHLGPDTPIPANATIVYCPRTHAAFGHPPHPFRGFLARGVRVALGTDSLASNPDLDLLAEARLVHRLHPDLPGDVLLRMATLSGAEALGWEDECGSLEPGKSADLVAVPLAPGGGEPYARLWSGGTGPRRVLCLGRWLGENEG